MPELKTTRYSTKKKNLYLNVAVGHFATGNGHTNYYIDVVSQKARISEARAVAKELCSEYYYYNTKIDTIVCLDGTEVIGTCLADEISKSDMANINSQKSMYVVTPETITHGGQFLFRDNIVPMIDGKNILILVVSVASGKTIETAIEAVKYYGGNSVGVASIFSTVDSCGGLNVHSVFDPNDLSDYNCYPVHDCPMCKAGIKIDGLVNSHGFSKLR